MSFWTNTILLVPKGEGDYLDRLAETYPVVGRQCQRIIDAAGTSDADVKVIVAAAQMLADYDDACRMALKHCPDTSTRRVLRSVIAEQEGATP